MDPVQPIVFGSFKSLNNRQAFGGDSYLSSALNVDIDNENLIRRRKGKRQIHITTTAHSLWSGSTMALFVDNGILMSIANDTVTPIAPTSTNRHHYAEVAGVVYISDGLQNWVLDGSGLRTWGVPAPTIASATVNVTGADKVSIVMTNIGVTGIESAASSPVTLNVTPSSIINVTASPTQVVYATALNGDTYCEVPSTFSADLFRNSTIEARFAGEPPTGVSCIAPFNGRLYVAVDNTLYFSDPFTFEKFDLRYNFIQFEAAITSIIPVDGGIYVAADRLHFLSGNNPDEFYRKTAYNHKVIKGVIDAMSDGSVVFISEIGVCIGDNQGIIKNITEENVSYDFGSLASCTVRRQDGVVQLATFFTAGLNSNTYPMNAGGVIIRRQ